MPYLTGDTTGVCQVTLSAPTDASFFAALVGAVSRLALAENWQQFGTVSPANAAELFGTVLDSLEYCNMALEVSKVIRTSNQTLANVAAWQEIIWQTNTPNMNTIPTVNNKLVPFSDGVYALSAGATIANSGTGRGGIKIEDALSGNVFATSFFANATTEFAYYSASCIAWLEAGSQVRVSAYGSAAALRTLSALGEVTHLCIMRLY